MRYNAFEFPAAVFAAGGAYGAGAVIIGQDDITWERIYCFGDDWASWSKIYNGIIDGAIAALFTQ